MKAKKIISMILMGVMAASLLAGCGSGANNSEKEETSQTSQTNETAAEETEAEESQDSAQASGDMETETGKTLVVYYSATGNTENVANVIAETTGGDLFELEPAEPYSDADLDWTDDNSRVSQAYANEEERDMELAADTAENWDSYDTVFIGYPKLYPTI